MTDSEGKKAHLLLILVLLDEHASNKTLASLKSQSDGIVLSVRNNPS